MTFEDTQEITQTIVRAELAQDGFDLPELAETMEEADARATASTYLFALRNVKRDADANDAEFTVLQDFNRVRHVARQEGLIRQMDYLRGSIEKLFGFMTTTGKKKSLNLIGGWVGMRAQTDQLVVEDDEAVIQWARDRASTHKLINWKPSVDRKQLRKFIDECAVDPELPPPPGVILKDRPDQFYATPAE